MAVSIYAFCLFILLWIAIGWQDWWLQRVKHKSLLYGSVGVCLGYGFLLIGGGFPYSPVTHFSLCIMAAMALWFLRVWPAGDAKLYIFLAFLYPLMNFSGPFPQERMFLIILINTFIPAAAFLFLKAAYYLFDTRFRHIRKFLLQLGWKNELDFLLQQLGQVLSGLWRSFGLKIASLREAGASGVLSEAFNQTASVLPTIIQWLMGIIFMSLVSYYLKDFFRSPILLSLLCMAMFMLWNHVSRALGTSLARLFLGTVIVALLTWFPPAHWESLRVIFANISIFSFFMFLGMSWAMKMMSTGGSFGGFLLTFLFSLLGLLLNQVWRYAAHFFSRLSAAFLVRWEHPSIQSTATGAAGNPYLDMMFSLAALGLFFGLCLVAVRKWDDEVRPSHTRDALAAYLVLDPAFVARLRQDGRFYDAHFQTLYADGLTADQAEALKIWCAENGIDTVPLAPTISFAFWIFFGFFLSVVLRGQHVLEAVL